MEPNVEQCLTNLKVLVDDNKLTQGNIKFIREASSVIMQLQEVVDALNSQLDEEIGRGAATLEELTGVQEQRNEFEQNNKFLSERLEHENKAHLQFLEEATKWKNDRDKLHKSCTNLMIKNKALRKRQDGWVDEANKHQLRCHELDGKNQTLQKEYDNVFKDLVDTRNELDRADETVYKLGEELTKTQETVLSHVETIRRLEVRCIDLLEKPYLDEGRKAKYRAEPQAPLILQFQLAMEEVVDRFTVDSLEVLGNEGLNNGDVVGTLEMVKLNYFINSTERCDDDDKEDWE